MVQGICADYELHVYKGEFKCHIRSIHLVAKTLNYKLLWLEQEGPQAQANVVLD